MSAEERAWLQGSMQLPAPYDVPRPLFGPEAWGAAIGVLFALAMGAAKSRAGVIIALAAGALFGGWHVVAAAVDNRRRRTVHAANRAAREAYAAQLERERALVLQDGRVTVRRVRATAVVEIEAVEDEGTGYVFDVGGGRVLFIKGPDFYPWDEDEPWPNTEFEIIRAATDGRIMGMHCHGTALPPLRVVPRDDLDPQKAWDEREEVLEMSVDDAVRTVLRDR